MISIAPGIEQWSWFSEEKQLNFNGLAITVNDECVIIDPPPISDTDGATLLSMLPTHIIITNRDHVREAFSLQEEYKIPIYVPLADAPQIEIPIDKTYEEGEVLPGSLKAIHLPNMKSPGESALLLEKDNGYLILGDALIGAPSGKLRLLPSDKLPNMTKAKDSLKRLLSYKYDIVLTGDGDSILSNGKDAVQKALEN